MSEPEPGPSQNPYGQPTNPYGQSADPNGQSSSNAYGQAYGNQPQPAYGSVVSPVGGNGGRPGTVTAAAWITIVLAGLSAMLYALMALVFLVASDTIVKELEKVREIQDADVDPGSIVGVLVVVMVLLAMWALISVVLAVFVLRRSNVARILLVISSVVVVIGSLLGITSGFSAIWLIGAGAVIVLLFVNGAGAWFNGTNLPDGRGAGGYQGGYQGGEQPYGGSPQRPGGSEYPPPDYPGR